MAGWQSGWLSDRELGWTLDALTTGCPHSRSRALSLYKNREKYEKCEKREKREFLAQNHWFYKQIFDFGIENQRKP